MPRTTHATPTPPTYDDIARKAYELYVLRGGAPGREVEDWLEAERILAEVRGERIDVSSESEVEQEAVTPAPARPKRAARASTPKPRAAARKTPDTPSVSSRARRKPKDS